MTKIRLSPEYNCNPIWDDIHGGDYEEDELRDKLGLDIFLISDLKLLQNMWDATYVANDPHSSGFKTEKEQFEFDIFALNLVWELQQQLPNYRISFYSVYFKQEVVLGN